MISSSDLLSRLQNWYESNCNGNWEHEKGVRIDCIDNPGWSVTIDLQGTSLEGKTMESFHLDEGEKKWIHCEVKNEQFIGFGSPQNLENVLKTFFAFASATSAAEGKTGQT